MSQENWHTKLINEDCAFRQRRVAYSSSSLFVLIYSKSNVAYDREVLGETLLDEDFGCIDPPGPNGGFGKLFNQEMLEDNDGKFSMRGLRSIMSSEDIANELFPYLDGIFTANEDECLFQENWHSNESLLSLIDSASDNDRIEIVEFEPD